jgi:hypothetical protein
MGTKRFIIAEYNFLLVILKRLFACIIKYQSTIIKLIKSSIFSEAFLRRLQNSNLNYICLNL